MAYGDHPYGRPADGTLESVPKIEIADLKDYVSRVLAKDTLKVAVVGDVDPDTLGKLLDKTFGSLPAKASLTPIPDVVAAKPPQRVFIPLDVPQTVVTFGGPGITPPRSGFHGGLCRQPHSRRRHLVVAALSRSPREARPGLFGL